MRHLRIILLVIVLALAAFWHPSPATAFEASDWIVSPSGPLFSISEALEKASDGDRIIVRGGFYQEALTIE